MSNPGSSILSIQELVDSGEFYAKVRKMYIAGGTMYPNFNLMIQQLNQSHCEKFKEFITKPNLIFVNTKPVLINYDYQLVILFSLHVSYPSGKLCHQQYGENTNQILALLD